MNERVVLDASVGVKWFKEEPGSRAAARLYERGAAGEVHLYAPTHFVHEVLAFVRRDLSYRSISEGWRYMQASGITVIPLSDEVIAEAAAQCEALGCSFYDSLAPACALLLDATLASADRRAHGAFPGVLLIED